MTDLHVFPGADEHVVERPVLHPRWVDALDVAQRYTLASRLTGEPSAHLTPSQVTRLLERLGRTDERTARLAWEVVSGR